MQIYLEKYVSVVKVNRAFISTLQLINLSTNLFLSYLYKMNWSHITSLEHLANIDEQSASQAVIIFKHSTTCSISAMALNRIESNWREEYEMKAKPFLLDLLANRYLSNEIAIRYGVIHESPQVLIIVGGKSVYDESHSGIRLNDLLDVVK